ncbi:hypothetical protein MHK_004265, partial [Candidatus Magnetomorum sp. HK-1]
FKDISSNTLKALRERFVLYVKMPESFYQYIERSEKNDKIGDTLTRELYQIFDECVFANNGRWNDNGRQAEMLEKLKRIYNII